MPDAGEGILGPLDPVERWTAAVQAIEAAQQTVLEQVRIAGVPAQWFTVLRLLYAAPDGRLPMTKLAHDVGISSGGLTKLADRMACDGLIDRRGVSTDRRVVHAVLTKRGRTLARTCLRVYDDAVTTLVLSAVADRDLAALGRIADQLAPLCQPEPDRGTDTSEPFLIAEPAADRPTPARRRADRAVQPAAPSTSA